MPWPQGAVRHTGLPDRVAVTFAVHDRKTGRKRRLRWAIQVGDAGPLMAIWGEGGGEILDVGTCTTFP